MGQGLKMSPGLSMQEVRVHATCKVDWLLPGANMPKDVRKRLPETPTLKGQKNRYQMIE